jgi:hypothetical protein
MEILGIDRNDLLFDTSVLRSYPCVHQSIARTKVEKTNKLAIVQGYVDGHSTIPLDHEASPMGSCIRTVKLPPRSANETQTRTPFHDKPYHYHLHTLLDIDGHNLASKNPLSTLFLPRIYRLTYLDSHGM